MDNSEPRVLQYSDEADRKILKTISTDCVLPDDIGMLLKASKTCKNICINKGGVGLASNQIGINKRFFFMITRNNEQFYVNPILEKGVGSTISSEGCLSFKGSNNKQVKRFKKVYVSFTSLEDGERYKQTLEGLEAIVFQHELDHLNGITI